MTVAAGPHIIYLVSFFWFPTPARHLLEPAIFACVKILACLCGAALSVLLTKTGEFGSPRNCEAYWPNLGLSQPTFEGCSWDRNLRRGRLWTSLLTPWKGRTKRAYLKTSYEWLHWEQRKKYYCWADPTIRQEWGSRLGWQKPGSGHRPKAFSMVAPPLWKSFSFLFQQAF